jgi:hypothetical protein
MGRRQPQRPLKPWGISLIAISMAIIVANAE